jgi:hypothetical protein
MITEFSILFNSDSEWEGTGILAGPVVVQVLAWWTGVLAISYVISVDICQRAGARRKTRAVPV